MKLLLAHHSPLRRARILARLQNIVGVQISFVASDLTETFNAAEHIVPDAIIIADLLAQWPEFEVLKALFDALRIPCLLLEDDQSSARRKDTHAHMGVTRISETASSEIFRETLNSITTGRKSAPVAVVRPTSDAGSFDTRKAILIGSSTGGVDALIRVLRSFPENCPPTLIVQHTGDGFAESLIRVLDRDARPQVVEANNGGIVAPGHVYLSTGKRHHLKFVPGAPARMALEEGPAMSGHRPSVDALFRSGLSAPRLIVAALLTGMGRDGAEGITALKRAGSFTIGQDQATSVVYGMPRVAFEMGGISSQLPIDQIGGELLRRCKVGTC
jgi:two-component system, chemotaxis family, protein-glutamate methylesterase/glutaminase